MEIPGLGKVLDSFEVKYSLFNVDKLNNSEPHNELSAISKCYSSWLSYWYWGHEPFATDTTTFNGQKVGENDYVLQIKVNSEAEMLLWNGAATTTFKYDGAFGNWSMSSRVIEHGQERDYEYCFPSAVIDTLIESVRCYMSNYPQYAESRTLETLIGSISGQEANIEKNAGPLYPAADCKKNVPIELADPMHDF